MLYVRLRDTYRRSKMLLLLELDHADTAQCERRIEKTGEIAGQYDAAGHAFGGKLRRALLDMFTFLLLHPGMEPTNNLAERSLGPSAMARNVRHALRTVEGMEMFGVLMTCTMAWRARGLGVSRMLRMRLPGTMDACVGA